MSKPRITASAYLDSYNMDSFTTANAYETPGGEISISYDCDDAKAALNALNRLTDDVRDQIRRTIEMKDRGDE